MAGAPRLLGASFCRSRVHLESDGLRCRTDDRDLTH